MGVLVGQDMMTSRALATGATPQLKLAAQHRPAVLQFATDTAAG